MDKFNQEIFEMIGRCRPGRSRAAAGVVGNECQMIVSNNPNRIQTTTTTRRSKAASVQGINKMKAIHDFIASNGRV